jgi:hypothetical protein
MSFNDLKKNSKDLDDDPMNGPAMNNPTNEVSATN